MTTKLIGGVVLFIAALAAHAQAATCVRFNGQTVCGEDVSDPAFSEHPIISAPAPAIQVQQQPLCVSPGRWVWNGALWICVIQQPLVLPTPVYTYPTYYPPYYVAPPIYLGFGIHIGGHRR